MPFTGPQKSALLLLAGYGLFLATAEPVVSRLYLETIQQDDVVSRYEDALHYLHQVLDAFYQVQIVILALWAALASAPLRQRLTGTLIAGTALLLVHAAVVTRFTSASLYNTGLSEALHILYWMLLFPLLYVPLVFARVKLGWRFTPSPAAQAAPPLRTRQFTMADLIIWTAYIGVTLALSRLIFWPSLEWFTLSTVYVFMQNFLINFQTVVFYFPPCFFLVAAYADPRRRRRWLGIGIQVTAVWTCGFGILLGALLYPQLISSLLREDTLVGYFLRQLFFALLHVCLLAAGAIASLAILALGGWRLTRINPAPPPGQLESKPAAPD